MAWCAPSARVLPPVGCRGSSGWKELSDKAYGFSAWPSRYGGPPTLHRGATDREDQSLLTTCAEDYARFEQIFDTTPKSACRTSAHRDTPVTARAAPDDPPRGVGNRAHPCRRTARA